MKNLLVAALILTSTPALAGELIIANGLSGTATPIGDQSKVQKYVKEAAIENAIRKLPRADLRQRSGWQTSNFYGGSSIYGVATASFESPEESGPWQLRVNGKYDQISKDELKKLPAVMEKVKASALERANFYCGTEVKQISSWNEKISPDSYGVTLTVYASARFKCQ